MAEERLCVVVGAAHQRRLNNIDVVRIDRHFTRLLR